jgi:hypothetical protein
MLPSERCDEIVRLIDEVLHDESGALPPTEYFIPSEQPDSIATAVTPEVV